MRIFIRNDRVTFISADKRNYWACFYRDLIPVTFEPSRTAQFFDGLIEALRNWNLERHHRNATSAKA
jgi:hypothetical protein